MPQTANHGRNASLSCLFAVGILLLSPNVAHADAGIPMLPFAYPVIVVFLLPVIAIEAIYIRMRLRTDWGKTISATAKANLVTMLLGFPLAWLVFLLLEILLYAALLFSGIENHIHWTLSPRATDFLIVITSAAWMEPIEEKWAVPVAYVALLIPSLFLSGYVESRLLDKRGWLKSEGRSAAVVWQANILSYIFLALVGCLALVTVVAHL
jgi:hypothetical protein